MDVSPTSGPDKLRALIVDDEAPDRARLRRLLTPHGDVQIVGEAHDGDGELPFALAAGDIVVDATASAGLAAWHPRWLRRGHRVVTANKLGLGGPGLRAREILEAIREKLGENSSPEIERRYLERLLDIQ